MAPPGFGVRPGGLASNAQVLCHYRSIVSFLF